MIVKNLKGLTYHIHTFGCQMNESDSEHIAGILIKAGATLSSSLEQSDIVILNTCAVREKSVDKLYSFLGRLKPFKRKRNTIIGVVGCVAQLQKAELLDRKPFIDFIVGPDNYWKLPEILPTIVSEKPIATGWSRGWHEMPSGQIERNSPVSAYVTIMEGCNNFCSYCVVPFTRGREKFRPLPHILEEVRDSAAGGYKEIQLLGQNVNSYRDPASDEGFSRLLQKVSRVKGIEWIRFITSNPENLTEDIAKTMASSKKICRQLHLPLQSGSSEILKKMKRKYTQAEYLEKIALLRRYMPDIHLSTDIIVGFPGETEEYFQETFNVLKTVGFSNIFSFRYSPRPFTAAARIEDSVPFEVKKRRLIELQALQKEIQLEKNRSLAGHVMKVLCTGKSKKDADVYAGRNDAYQVVNFRADTNAIGQFVDVLITSCGPYSLQGKIAHLS